MCKNVRIELKDGRERLKICSDGGLDNFISLSATSVISGILECGYEGLCALMWIRAGLRGRNITTQKHENVSHFVGVMAQSSSSKT